MDSPRARSFFPAVLLKTEKYNKNKTKPFKKCIRKKNVLFRMYNGTLAPHIRRTAWHLPGRLFFVFLEGYLYLSCAARRIVLPRHIMFTVRYDKIWYTHTVWLPCRNSFTVLIIYPGADRLLQCGPENDIFRGPNFFFRI